MADIIPKRLTDLRAFAVNLKAKIAGYQVTFGLTAQDTAQVVGWCEGIIYGVDRGEVVSTYAQEFTAFRDVLLHGPVGSPAQAPPALAADTPPDPLALPGIIPQMRDFLQTLKRHPNCTPAIEEDLWLRAAQPQPPAEIKPVGEAVALPGFQTRIEFRKGRYTGVLIYSRRGGETEWTSLGLHLYSPYVDTRPPLVAGTPEQREYRLMYVEHEQPVGEYSDIFVATARP